MRKTPSKLALRKETLRALSNMNLTRVIGGQGDVAVDGTFRKECPAPAIDGTVGKECLALPLALGA
jgi:hypothetical protein